MIRIDYGQLMDLDEDYYHLGDKVAIKKVRMKHLLSNDEEDLKLVAFKSLFTTEPIDIYEQLYDEGIMYYDIDAFDFFKLRVIDFQYEQVRNDILQGGFKNNYFHYIVDEEKYQKLMQRRYEVRNEEISKLDVRRLKILCRKHNLSCVNDNGAEKDKQELIDTINNKPFDINIVYIAMIQSITLYDKEHDFTLDKNSFDDIREVYFQMFCSKPSKDYLHLDKKSQVKGLVDAKRNERELLHQYGRLTQQEREAQNNQWQSILIAVINLGDNGIDFTNYHNYIVMHIIESYKVIEKSLMYNAQQSGLYSQVDFSKLKKHDFIKII